MMRSTFSGFTIAQLAMRASQRAIDVTGQNIANINTKGYTKQQLDLVSLNLRGGDRVGTGPGSKIGYGVEITGISQVRDPFLDVQYRSQIAKVGTADGRQGILDQLGDIFDETDAEGIRKALSDLSSSLDKLSSNAGNTEFDSIVRSRAQVLLNFMHQKSDDLKNVREENISGLENTEIAAVNSLLSDIGELNDSIWDSQVLGNPALELLDERNSKLDDLASYLPISVSYKEVSISKDVKFSYPVVKFMGSNGVSYPLTAGEHGENYASLSVSRDTVQVGNETKKTGSVSLFIIPASDFSKSADVSGLKAEITDNMKEGTLQGALDMINKSGELDDPPSDYRGIGYYEKTFDALAASFAETFNKLNQTNPPNGNTNDLFSTSDGSGVFTASNIKISDGWMNNTVHILTSTKTDAGSTDNDNIINMINALKEERSFSYQKNAGGNSIEFYKGSFAQCYSNIENTQGLDSSANTAILDNHISVLQQTANNRDAVSGVSLDEEGVSLMQYQRSYTAAARLMTTLDEALDTLINKTGVVGR